jgi:hypothetical protein
MASTASPAPRAPRTPGRVGDDDDDASPSPPSSRPRPVGDGPTPERAVKVLDDALDLEGKAVKAAMDRLQRCVARTPAYDAEITSREGDAAALKRSRGYKSPYHDAHHATLVAASSALRRALESSDGVSGADATTLVNDALFMIEGAAKDALRRDQGERAILWECAKEMKDRRDEARAAARELVLAFAKERQGVGFRERLRLRDEVQRAKDEARAEHEKDKARVMEELRAMAEELNVMQQQMGASRDADAVIVRQLNELLASERRKRYDDGLEYENARLNMKSRAEKAELECAKLGALIRVHKQDAEATQRDLEKKIVESAATARQAVSHVAHARKQLQTQKRKSLRECAFRLWKGHVKMVRAIRKVRQDGDTTIVTIKTGYERQMEKLREEKNKARFSCLTFHPSLAFNI